MSPLCIRHSYPTEGVSLRPYNAVLMIRIIVVRAFKVADPLGWKLIKLANRLCVIACH